MVYNPLLSFEEWDYSKRTKERKEAMNETYISKGDRKAYIAVMADMIFASPYWTEGRNDAIELAKEIMETLDPKERK